MQKLILILCLLSYSNYGLTDPFKYGLYFGIDDMEYGCKINFKDSNFKQQSQSDLNKKLQVEIRYFDDIGQNIGFTKWLTLERKILFEQKDIEVNPSLYQASWEEEGLTYGLGLWLGNEGPRYWILITQSPFTKRKIRIICGQLNYYEPIKANI